ncbi:uncharacterized protein V1510DRAFT_370893 [Dipodascopsis tothii]|uniref:uncharacterized protein n=1 Tax=Dipodascopsis tothii TaxID=44089 RepID=UPI0034CF137D
MARQISGETGAVLTVYDGGTTLAALPKGHSFTSKLPAESELPTPSDAATAESTSPELFRPRIVRDGAFAYVKPAKHDAAQATVVAVSPTAMRDLGLAWSEAGTAEFRDFVIGNRTWADDGIYPWAQAYGGWQFGQWAGQLGDGRVVTLFDAPAADGSRLEVQIKGAGMTPFSRFADGCAVLRSSIREFLVSEALHGLGVPTTRALALARFHNEKVLRERIEPRAVVVRMAPSWLRIGSFELQQSRGNRRVLRALADYTIDHVYGGVDALVPARADQPGGNRFLRLYREVAKRTAALTAQWQAYGFMNGVLNTDNVSIAGLSIDFGPFSFMDTFDPSFTPNHDDGLLRYSYRNQPTVMWWNLVRLGEALFELFASGDAVDADAFCETGIPAASADATIALAEGFIETTGEEYRAWLTSAYAAALGRRLGLVSPTDADATGVIQAALDLMKEHELDFHMFFRRLGAVPLFGPAGADVPDDAVLALVPADRGMAAPRREDSAAAVRDFLRTAYRPRLESEGSTDDAARRARMDAVNPRFVLRNWILDEVIDRVERQEDKYVLDHVLSMIADPFRDSWAAPGTPAADDERRFLADVPRNKGGIMCSCSS